MHGTIRVIVARHMNSVRSPSLTHARFTLRTSGITLPFGAVGYVSKFEGSVRGTTQVN